jgi:Terminase large subunit, T4likevirus-type, N-terminal
MQIAPQPGLQTDVLSSPADIVICGGAAGSGKTAVLLLDAARWHFLPGYGAVIFRRTFPEIVAHGGLWEQSEIFYTPLAGKPTQSPNPKWVFENGAQVSFSHLQYEKNLTAHQGAQYAFIGFDELTHFSRKEFIYLMSRNRSVCGIDPIIRCTCNPDPNSWVADFISWFIDQDTGYPILERSGMLRYFTNDNNVFVWGETKQEVIQKCPHIFGDTKFVESGIDPEKLIKSMTFIPGSIYENKILLDSNSSYLGNLMALDEEDKLRLLYGNWKASTDQKELFPLIKIKDIFSNILPEKAQDKLYITIDHARLGKDFATIFTWRGFKVIRIDILPISKTGDIVKVVMDIRRQHRPIPVSNIICDQDGIGVHDAIDCHVFQGGATAIKVDSDIHVDYKNRRVQNYFMLSEKIDNSQVSCDLSNCWLWEKDGEHLKQPVRVSSVKWGGATFTIQQLITDDLRTIRRHNSDKENRKMVTPKEQQKNALGGRSPDFGDNFMMRMSFEFISQPKYIKTN